MAIQRGASAVLGLVLVWTSVCVAAEPVALFNGKDLSGWKRRGGKATYAVEDGAIVGRSVPNTYNTFLCTEKEYGDFELELDFKIDDTTFNSGVQIRSHTRPEDKGERVYGYQIEIDPRTDRKWSGGLYYEAGKRQWLDDLTDNDAAREAFRLGEWNHFRILVKGHRIQSWINGVPAADFTDTDEKNFSPSGFIGLQVHQVGKERKPKEVRWRNIKLTEPGADSTSAQTTTAAGGGSNSPL